MSLRSATPADLNDLINLYVLGWRTAYADIVDSGFLADMSSNPRSRDYLSSLLSDARQDAVVLLDEVDGRISGFIAAGRTRDKVDTGLAEIYAVYIDLDHQQQSIGRQLFDACTADLKKQGFDRLHVWTFAANTSAQKAYTRWGGTLHDETRMVTVGGDNLEEVGFDWRL